MRDIDQMAAGVRRVAGGTCWPAPEHLRQLEERRHALRRRVTVSALLAVIVLAGAIAFPAIVTARSRAATVPVGTPVRTLPGTLYYLSPGHDLKTLLLADHVTLYSRTGSEPPRVLGTFPTDGSQLFEMTVTVSPDGRRLAWTDGNDLYTSMIDGSGRHAIAPAGAPGCAPSWTPDSRLVYPDTSLGEEVINVDGTGAQFLKVPFRCDKTLLADGQRMAWSDIQTDDSGRPLSFSIVIGDIGTGKTQDYPVHHAITQLVAISPDARHAVVELPATDAVAARDHEYPVRHQNGALVDLRTGSLLPSPVPGDIVDAFYQKDGTLLLRYVEADQYCVGLIGARGTLVARTAETGTLTQDSLIAYVP
jgi:hypothetical protein